MITGGAPLCWRRHEGGRGVLDWRQNVYVFTGKVVTKWEIYYLVGINRDLTAPGAPRFMIHITSRDIPGIISLTNHNKKGYVYACVCVYS